MAEAALQVRDRIAASIRRVLTARRLGLARGFCARRDPWAHDGRTRLSNLLRSKSRSPGGRLKLSIEVRSLIRRMSVENPLWGAPRIHGELLKLGIAVAQSTVAKYMAKSRPGGA